MSLAFCALVIIFYFCWGSVMHGVSYVWSRVFTVMMLIALFGGQRMTHSALKRYQDRRRKELSEERKRERLD